MVYMYNVGYTFSFSIVKINKLHKTKTHLMGFSTFCTFSAYSVYTFINIITSNTTVNRLDNQVLTI